MSGAFHVATRALAAATLALVGVVVVVPGRVELAVRVYALVVCVVGLAVALSALRSAYPPASPVRRSRSTEPDRQPASLARLEHVLSLGTAGAFDFHHRVLPRLTALAGGLLDSRRRVAIADTERARAILGDETWDLVRPDRPPPEDRLARGVPVADLERAVASLERV